MGENSFSCVALPKQAKMFQGGLETRFSGVEESRGTQGRSGFTFHSFCMFALISHQEPLKSEVKVLRQGWIPQALKCFLSSTWTPPSFNLPESTVTGEGSKQHSKWCCIWDEVPGKL